MTWKVDRFSFVCLVSLNKSCLVVDITDIEIMPIEWIDGANPEPVVESCCPMRVGVGAKLNLKGNLQGLHR